MSNETPSMTMQEAIEAWRKEMTSYLQQIKNFPSRPVGDILRDLSAWSGRAYYIRMRVIRDQASATKTFRTQEVDYFIQCIDTQFKIWSRVQSALKEEWDMSR